MPNEAQYIQQYFTYASTDSLEIGYLPPNAYVTQIKVACPVAFNVGSADYLDIGITGSNAYFADNVDLGGTGDRTVTSTAQWGNVQSTTDPTLVTMTYTPTNTAPTAGQAMVTVFFSYDEN